MCFVCLQRSDGSFQSYASYYKNWHGKATCKKDHKYSHCDCIDCSFGVETAKVEHSMLVYLCDALDYAPIEKVPILLKLAISGDRPRTEYFKNIVDRFVDIDDKSKIQELSKQLRKELL